MPPKSELDSVQLAFSDRVAQFVAERQITSNVAGIKKEVDSRLDEFESRITSIRNDVSSNTKANEKSFAQVKTQQEMLEAKVQELETVQVNPCQVQEAQCETQMALFKSTSAQKAQTNLKTSYNVLLKDVKTAQSQYRLSLEQTESLKAEIKKLQDRVRHETQRNEGLEILVNGKLAELEHQLEIAAQALQEIPKESIAVLSLLASQQEPLSKWLDQASKDEDEQSEVSSDQEVTTAVSLDNQSDASMNRGIAYPVQDEVPTNLGQVPPVENSPGKRKQAEAANELNKSEPKRVRHPVICSFGRLFKKFRTEYQERPPRSDFTYIWRFIDMIEDDGLHRHVQEAVMKEYPDRVRRMTKSKRKKNQRHEVIIPKNLTWEDFCEVIKKIQVPDHLIERTQAC